MIVIPLSRPDAPPLPPSSRGGEASSSESTPATRSAPRRRARRDTITPSPRATPSAASSSSSAPSSSSSSRQPTPDTPAIPPSSTCSSSPHRDLARVWEAVSTSRRIVVVTGAGISVSSPANIPDFRSSTGLFKTLKEQHPNAGLSSGKDLFDARLFQSEANTALFYSMIAQLHDMTLKAQPTLFHHLIKRLDEQGRLQRVYTQNIDALEERTGLTFGLGNGARKTFQRTASLGKRKRLAAAAAASADAASTADANGAPTRPRWSKTQSAPVHSHLLGGPDDSEPATAMFPRVIPLHGSLAHLVCTACDFRLATLPQPTPQVQAALKELAEGETPACPACSERESVRIAAGLRSRGIGFLKPDVVLYNGDNKSGERVGECLERDVLGLRDRLDGQVPETYAEERARVRKEEKAMATAAQKKQQQQQQQEVAPPPASTLMSISESSSSIASLGSSADDVLGQAFEEDEEEDKAMVARDLGAAPTSSTTTTTSSSSSSPAAKLFQDVRAKRSLKRATTQPAPVPSSSSATSANPKKAAPLKPLPPDLLIVAGTSLKVPGTKRVVREFAKAARARDGIVPKGCATAARSKAASAASSSRENSKTPSNSSSAKTSRSGSWESAEASDEDGSGGEDEEEEEEDGEDGTDPTRPIRTILLNYDFPVPSKEWEDIFDVWVQGDVQAAAGGLWSASAGYGSGNAIGGAAEGEGEQEGSTIDGVRSWDLSLDELEETRSELKKAEREEKRALRLQEADGSKASSSSSSSTSRARPRTSKQATTSGSIKAEDEMDQDESSPRRPSSRTRLNSPTVLIPKMTISDSGATSTSTSKKNLGPSAKTNGVDKMFPPAKRAAGRASTGAGAKAGGGGGAKQGSDAGAGAGVGRASRGRTSSTSGSTRKASTARG